MSCQISVKYCTILILIIFVSNCKSVKFNELDKMKRIYKHLNEEYLSNPIVEIISKLTRNENWNLCNLSICYHSNMFGIDVIKP